jgi:hypothetical protein
MMKNVSLVVLGALLFGLSSCGTSNKYATIVDSKGIRHEVRVAPSQVNNLAVSMTITAYQTHYMPEPVCNMASMSANIADSTTKGVIRGEVVSLTVHEPQ